MVGNRMGWRGLLAALGAALAFATVLLWAASAHSAPGREFDLQEHRGGLGLRPESTLSAFGNAMQLGVSTLELDVQITENGVAVVTHDRQISPIKCQDTAPAFPGDPEYPYVGKYIKTLTLEQVKTLDCGTRRTTDPNDPFVKTMEMVPGSKMPKLIANTGFTGFYMRVLSEGMVAADDGFDLVRAHPERITIAELNSIIYEQSYDVTLIKRLAELPEFSEVGRTLFAQRLGRLARG
jgi:glycerophosphoryl diester phosphodiesterase